MILLVSVVFGCLHSSIKCILLPVKVTFSVEDTTFVPEHQGNKDCPRLAGSAKSKPLALFRNLFRPPAVAS